MAQVDFDQVRRKLAAGADINEAWRGRTALHGAATKAILADVQFLLEQCADVNVQSVPGGWSPLHYFMYARSREDYRIECARCLIAADANLNAVTRRNDTPLHKAAKRQPLALVEDLVRSGCRTDIRNNQGQTALDLASSSELRGRIVSMDPKIVEFLTLRSRENVIRALTVALGDMFDVPTALIELIADFVTLI